MKRQRDAYTSVIGAKESEIIKWQDRHHDLSREAHAQAIQSLTQVSEAIAVVERLGKK